VWAIPRINAKRYEYGSQAFPGVLFAATLSNLNFPLCAFVEGLAVLFHPLYLDDCFQLRYGSFQDVVNQNIAVLAVILNLLAGLVLAQLQNDFVNMPLGAASVSQSCA
jgi:hypothetical protein